MEFNYFIFSVISVLTSASSKAFTIISKNSTKEFARSLARDRRNMEGSKLHNVVQLPTYSLYLIGFTILLLVLAVIALSVALYFVVKKKSIFGFNVNNKQYIRQESTGVTPLCKTQYDEDNKNNGSTLSLNSGIIEISESRASDPITPTRLENSKIIFAKKPVRPILPVMQRGQMDAICKEVLRKVQKSDSASFRDLNDLLKFEKKEESIGTKEETVEESEKEKNNEENTELTVKQQLFKLNKKPEEKTETTNEVITKDKTKQETKNKTTNESESKLKPDENKDVRIEVNNVESDKTDGDASDETEYDTVPTPIIFRHSHPEPDQGLYDTVPNPAIYRHSGPEPDQTFYDTVPNPTQYRHSGPEPDSDQAEYDTVPRPKSFRLQEPKNDELDEIPLYDLPPSQSNNESPRNVIHLDLESQYLMPISSNKTDPCYINAKRQSFQAP